MESINDLILKLKLLISRQADKHTLPSHNYLSASVSRTETTPRAF